MTSNTYKLFAFMKTSIVNNITLVSNRFESDLNSLLFKKFSNSLNFHQEPICRSNFFNCMNTKICTGNLYITSTYL